MSHSVAVNKWDCYEIKLQGPNEGNPFTSIQLSAEFICKDRTIKTEGFYDGDGTYIIRCMPDVEGLWQYQTESNVPELSGITGNFTCTEPLQDARGVVRANNTHYFAYDDGTPFIPLGTTAYAWIHQEKELVEKTTDTLSKNAFNKIRMCVFPKHYDFNHNEPPMFAYERNHDGTFNHFRFNVKFFRYLEGLVAKLRDFSIEADIILFHPYDRWGFSEMASEADDLYLKYITARLSAFRNVWWSLANEYDLMHAKKMEDWDRFCNILVKYDPYNHLRSIHNCRPQDRYDHNKTWITHACFQYQEDDLSVIGKWREQYNKPIVIDECGYEGDIDHGWGNLPPQELVYKSWQFVMSGAHTCAHGETYYNPEEILWWSKGGVLKGQSPARLAFLREIIEGIPYQLNPSNKWSSWDFKGISTEDEGFIIIYYGRKQPSFKRLNIPDGQKYKAEIIDTWNMTRKPIDQILQGKCRITLPGKQFIALCLRKVD